MKFDISSNRLYEAGTKAIAEALKGNNIMTELNIAGNLMEKDGAMDIAKTIPTMGAMAKFTFSGMVGTREGPPVTAETSMTEADFSKKMLGASGAIMLAAFLPKCQ